MVVMSMMCMCGEDRTVEDLPCRVGTGIKLVEITKPVLSVGSNHTGFVILRKNDAANFVFSITAGVDQG